jgi:hypothetical protein
MPRNQPALGEPTAERVTRVPDRAVAEPVYRAQWDHLEPWWFSTRTDNPRAGRFDLPLPHGTCYFADDPVATLIEKLVDPAQAEPLVRSDDLDRLRIWSGRLPPPWERVADTTDRASRVPKELGTITPYDLPWRWADALHADGRSALRYWLRLDPGAGRGVAVFSDHGAPAEPPPLDPEPAAAHAAGLREAVDVLESPPTLGMLSRQPDP